MDSKTLEEEVLFIITQTIWLSVNEVLDKLSDNRHTPRSKVVRVIQKLVETEVVTIRKNGGDNQTRYALKSRVDTIMRRQEIRHKALPFVTSPGTSAGCREVVRILRDVLDHNVLRLTYSESTVTYFKTNIDYLEGLAEKLSIDES